MARPNRSVPPNQVEAPAVRGEEIPKGAKYVTVASKLPMDIEIQLCRETTAAVTGQFGSVKETINVKTGRMYYIRGTAYPVGQPPKGFPKAPNMIDAGYALTSGIPADFWAEWLRQNQDTEMVRNGLIKAAATQHDVEAKAAEHADVQSGLQPLDPDGDPRNPKPMNAAIENVKRAQAGADA